MVESDLAVLANLCSQNTASAERYANSRTKPPKDFEEGCIIPMIYDLIHSIFHSFTIVAPANVLVASGDHVIF
jgi:hypothetical protein